MIERILKQKIAKFYTLYSLLALSGIASIVFYLSYANEVDLFMPVGIASAWLFLIYQAYTKHKQQMQAFNENYDTLTEQQKKMLEDAMVKSTIKTKHFYINQFGICSLMNNQCIYLKKEVIQKAVVNRDFYQRVVVEVYSGEEVYKFHLKVQDEEQKIKALFHKYKIKQST